MALAAVLIRQLTTSDNPVAAGVVTSKDAEEYRIARGIHFSAFDVKRWMDAKLEEVKEDFCKDFPKFAKARWVVNYLDYNN